MKKYLFIAAAALLSASCFHVNVNFKDFGGTFKNAIKGETGSDFCYSLGQYASVVYSQPDEITKAVDEIVKTAMNE